MPNESELMCGLLTLNTIVRVFGLPNCTFTYPIMILNLITLSNVRSISKFLVPTFKSLIA